MFDLNPRNDYGNYMLLELLAVTEAADNASQLAANIGVGALVVVIFVKFFQIVFRKSKPRE